MRTPQWRVVPKTAAAVNGDDGTSASQVDDDDDYRGAKPITGEASRSGAAAGKSKMEDRDCWTAQERRDLGCSQSPSGDATKHAFNNTFRLEPALRKTVITPEEGRKKKNKAPRQARTSAPFPHEGQRNKKKKKKQYSYLSERREMDREEGAGGKEPAIRANVCAATRNFSVWKSIEPLLVISHGQPPCSRKDAEEKQKPRDRRCGAYITST
ncbi:hypothetical protein HPB50_016353 [Hyalomma asiaticum]|uniref:Uncharacterized protein n=1 Tax=Hyalomma asiaticum TaxID=266040 RepID=A0ACB7SP02_HYAAI|nr:hypothetical protein HPB50_016353 [Hyalomma asiaticum]